MIDSKSVKKAIVDMIVGEFLGKVLLSYLFDRNKLYNVLHAVELRIDPFHEDAVTYDRKYHMERSYRRIEHIAMRLKKDDNGESSMFASKIYDDVMISGVICGYNRVAAIMNRPVVRPVTEKFLQQANVSIAHMPKVYDDSLVRCGYCVDIREMDRSAITLPEIILYTAVYMSTRARAINTLNKELSEKKDYKRATQWYKKLKTELYAEEVYESIVFELFDMLFDEVAARFTEANESGIQRFWIDEKYRNRKDRKRVLDKLDTTAKDVVISWTHVEKQLDTHPERAREFIENYELRSITTMLLEDIMPQAEAIALKKVPGVSPQELELAKERLYLKDHILPDEKDLAEFERMQLREVATWLAEMVCIAIEESYNIVERMLQCLPEAIAWKNN